MRNGGIFNGPTALGRLGEIGDGGSIPCQGPSFFKALQAELARRGYGVRQDGIWDGCCNSAITKELGGPLWHTDQVKQFLGKTCSNGYVYFGVDPGGGALVIGPEHTVPPTCTDGSDSKTGGKVVDVKTCPSGQIFDYTLGQCVPTLDPLGCGDKCKSFPPMSAQWVQCVTNCNAGIVPKPPGPDDTKPPPPPPPPPPPVTPPGSDILGDYWPVIVAALAVGVGAVIYFTTRKKKPASGPYPLARTMPMTVRPRPNRRRRRRSRR